MTLSDVLDGFLSQKAKLLIATDFDGVIAPLVDDPTQSTPIAESRDALNTLARAGGQFSVAYVSGRRLDELAQLTRPAPGTWMFGGHGAQRGVINSSGELETVPLVLPPAARALLTEVKAAARSAASLAQGAWVEEKETSAVLHTRLASEAETEAAQKSFLAALAHLGAHVMTGHDVIEASVTDTNKGQAIAALRSELGVSSAIYFGDDVTDETVFSTLSDSDIGVKVGQGETAASHRVNSPHDVAHILQTIADRVNAG